MNVDYLKGKLLSLLEARIILDLLRTFLARGLAALGSVVLIVILGRLYGPSGVGLFALSQSILLGISTVSRYGMDGALMRFVGRERKTANIFRYLRWGMRKSLVISAGMALCLFLLRDFIECFFEASGIRTILVAFSIAVPGFTLSFLLSGFLKGVHKPATACLLENGGVSLVASLLIVLLHWWSPDSGLAGVAWAFALSAYLVFFVGLAQVIIWKNKQLWGESSEDGDMSKESFYSSSRNFFMLNFAYMIQTVISVWVAGYFVSSSDLGLFKTAFQIAMLIHFVLIVIDAIFPPRFSSLYYSGEFDKLQSLARLGSLVGIVISFPLLLICLCFPEFILAIFGENFKEASQLLQIMALGQFFNVSCGSVAHLLNMTGHGRLMKNIALVSSSVGILMMLILLPFLGVIGAAMMFSLMLVFQSSVALVCVWIKLGIWMFPAPNILKIIGVPTHAENK